MAEKPGYEELENEVVDLRQRNKELQEKNQKFRQLIENLNEVLYMLDLSATVTYISPNIEKISGYLPEEVIGRKFTEFVHPEDLADRMEYFLKVLSGQGITTEYRYITQSGGTVWVMTNARPVLKDNKVVGIQGMLVDITERKNMEQALRKSEEKYRNIIENIEDGYYELDTEGNFIFCNDSMSRILGYSRDELLDMNIKKLTDSINLRKIFDTAAWLHSTGKSCKAFDWNLIRKDGSACYINASISMVCDSGDNPQKLRGIARDVTERKKAEWEKKNLRAQLRRAQQMEAIGTLAGGIAHDFNNILSSVIGYAELSLSETRKESLLYKNISRILEAGNRAKDLVGQILTLAREEKEDFSPVPVAPMVKETIKLLRSTLPSTIEIIENIDNDENLIVNANPTQLHQIIMNLVTNAKYALGDNNGTLELRTEQVYFDKSVKKQDPKFKPGRYALISVSDTGAGISPENFQKIFEPYFTTKERGVGTGLGLSIVHGIVKKHEGQVNVYSELGRGTTFHVYLPLAPKSGDKPKPAIDTPLPAGKEKILLIDDEQAIVEMERQYLEKLGYKVTSRTSSIEALEAFKASPGRFDLVVTDMTMPNMSGDCLSCEIKNIRSDIPVILCTGFSEQLNKNDENTCIDAFLMKPVTRTKMAKTVRSLLDGFISAAE